MVDVRLWRRQLAPETGPAAPEVNVGGLLRDLDEQVRRLEAATDRLEAATGQAVTVIKDRREP